MPKLSVIVPVYKVEEFLVPCVESLLAQTFSDFEILLVDDGSPDRCPAICDEFAAQDSRIKVIHKKNGGVSSARNTGLDTATGEYITFVDSDDYIDTCMYQKMMDITVSHHCDVVMCDCLKEFSDHTELYTHDIRSGFYSRQQLETEYFPHLLMMENVEYPPTISNWLLLFRKETASSIRYPVGIRYSEDLLFGAQLMYNAQSFYYLKGEAYYHYRMNNQSASHRFVPDKWNDYQKLHHSIRNYFSDCAYYDFSHQIDLCLLFFLYNAIGDILGTKQISNDEKKEKIRQILCTHCVDEMFNRLKINHLPISTKQKLITWLYKNKVVLSLLIHYYS